jgi:SAM-dependent methyltransferase
MTDVVASGYDAVYSSWASGTTFHELWARHAVGGEMAAGFEHLNFATTTDLDQMRSLLEVGPGDCLVDLASGAGGPGAWVARESGAALVGVDLSRVGMRVARRRAAAVGLRHASFVVARAHHLPLRGAFAAGVMSLDSLQYVPDKHATFAEAARVLGPRGRFVFTAFELAPEQVRNVPVLGIDPVRDYARVLADVGFTVEAYEETPGWHDRLVSAYSAVVEAEARLRPELGNVAMDALLWEMSFTLEIEPYARRVLAVARSRG